MNKQDVRIESVKPMRVASVLGYGREPETEAWGKLVAWAQPKGYLDDPEKHPIFGFNNPAPSVGTPNYGYEFWIAIGDETEPGGEFEVKEFSGGLYAVLRCEVKNAPHETIPATWRTLVAWQEGSKYKIASDLCLEKHIRIGDIMNGDFALDLYLPITA